MIRRIAVVISGLLAVTMVPVSAPIASATEFPSGVVLEDGAGDVWVDRGGFGDAPTTRVSFPPADVKRAVVRHATYAVRIRMRFVNLRRIGGQDFQARIQTPQGEWVADVVSEAGRRSGRHFFNSDFFPGTCPAMTHRINYATDVVRMRIPRGCLGRPRWVKVQLANLLTLPIVPNSTDEFYFDNPHNLEEFGTDTRRLYRE